MILFYEITEFVLSEYLTLPDRIERPAAVAGVALRRAVAQRKVVCLFPSACAQQWLLAKHQ